MGYRSKPYRSSRKSSGSSAIKTVVLVVFLVGVFAGSVYLFRTSHASRAALNILSAVSAKTEGLSPSNEPETVTVELVNVENESGRVPSTGKHDTAILERKDGKLHVTLNTSPSPIDRQTTTYEAWLFSRLPFGFFSLGELTTDEQGVFILNWEQADRPSYGSYRTIIVTREAKDANPDPGVHVLEGTFEKK